MSVKRSSLRNISYVATSFVQRENDWFNVSDKNGNGVQNPPPPPRLPRPSEVVDFKLSNKSMEICN